MGEVVGTVTSKKEDYIHIENMIREGLLAEAEQILKPLLGSNDPWIFYYWGCVQMHFGNNGDAKEGFEDCLTLDPNNDAALFNLASILHKKGHKDKAKETFDKVLQLVPNAIIPRLDKAVVMIGLPHYGRIPMEFMISYLDMALKVQPSDNIEVMMTNCCGSRITSNRNQLVRLAQRKGATHIMFIDCDMIFPPDGLQRLLSHQKDIVCATTCKRGDEEGQPIGCAVPQDGNTSGKVLVTGGLIEMSLVGSCFMLIKMDVFDKVGLPAYYEPPNPEEGDAFGEDITFCKLAREKGYKIWVDYQLSTELGHLGDKIYQIKPASKEQTS